MNIVKTVLGSVITFFFGLVILLGCNSNPPVTINELNVETQKDPDSKWILTILNYESCCGSEYGTGLPHWGFTSKYYANKRPQNIEEAIRLFKRDFLGPAKQFPHGVRERVADFYFNSGKQPKLLLLYANRNISFETLRKNKLSSSLWERNKKEILAKCNSTSFISAIDEAKIEYYKWVSTAKKNNAFDLTWEKRVKMWKEQ